MSSGLKFWCVLLLIPVLASVAHDGYHSYYSTKEKQQKLENLQIDLKSYQVSDFGYIVANYVPGIYDSLRRSMGEDAWNKWANPVLKQHTIVLAIIPNLLFWIYLLIARVLGLAPFGQSFEEREPAGAKKRKDPLERRNAKAVKYSRR